MAEAIVPAGAPTPVMDVVAPPPEKEAGREASTAGVSTGDPAGAAVQAPAAEIDPVDALAAADKRAQQADTDHKSDGKPVKNAHPSAKPPAHAPAKPKETAGSGVGLAITATVIVIFGLAILAVYAYVQTNK